MGDTASVAAGICKISPPPPAKPCKYALDMFRDGRSGGSCCINKRKQSRNQANAKEQVNWCRVNESMLRLSFLEQASRLLAVQSSEKDDIASLLSKNYVKEVREISFAEQLRMDTEFKRTICKRCHRMWVFNSKLPAISISKGRKKIYRKCLDCNAQCGFVLNTSYQAKNEK
uniref:Uncharacterized protein n=1 Tax=Ditylenchus dipsaci TaxID=166011 RepID=A0A915D8D7_9BILA